MCDTVDQLLEDALIAHSWVQDRDLVHRDGLDFLLPFGHAAPRKVVRFAKWVKASSVSNR
jgi:hypothetical protein